MAGQPRHLHSLLTFLDPLLCLAALVVELDDLPVPELRVSHDEAHPRKQFPGMELHLGNYPRPSARCLCRPGDPPPLAPLLE